MAKLILVSIAIVFALSGCGKTTGSAKTAATGGGNPPGGGGGGKPPSGGGGKNTPDQGFTCDDTKIIAKCLATIKITDDKKAMDYMKANFASTMIGDGNEFEALPPVPDPSFPDCPVNVGTYKQEDCTKLFKQIHTGWKLADTVAKSNNLKFSKDIGKDYVKLIRDEMWKVFKELKDTEFKDDVQTKIKELAKKFTLSSTFPGANAVAAAVKFDDLTPFTDTYKGAAFPECTKLAAKCAIFAAFSEHAPLLFNKDAYESYKPKCEDERKKLIADLPNEIAKYDAADKQKFDTYFNVQFTAVETIANTASGRPVEEPTATAPPSPARIPAYTMDIKLTNVPKVDLTKTGEFYFVIDFEDAGGKKVKDSCRQFHKETKAGEEADFTGYILHLPPDFTPVKYSLQFWDKDSTSKDDAIGHPVEGSIAKVVDGDLQEGPNDKKIAMVAKGKPVKYSITFVAIAEASMPEVGLSVEAVSIGKKKDVFFVVTDGNAAADGTTPSYISSMTKMGDAGTATWNVNMKLPAPTTAKVYTVAFYENLSPFSGNNLAGETVSTPKINLIKAFTTETATGKTAATSDSEVKIEVADKVYGASSSSKKIDEGFLKTNAGFDSILKLGVPTSSASYCVLLVAMVLVVMVGWQFRVSKVVPIDSPQIDLTSRLHSNP